MIVNLELCHFTILWQGIEPLQLCTALTMIIRHPSNLSLYFKVSRLDLSQFHNDQKKDILILFITYIATQVPEKKGLSSPNIFLGIELPDYV